MKVKLTDYEWQKILPVLKSCPQIRLGAGRDVRRFLEAVLWILRSGAQWQLLRFPGTRSLQAPGKTMRSAH